MSYMKSDVFLVCFAVDDPESLKSVEEHWVPELRHYLPETPFILVGTRADRRYDETSYTVGLTFLKASSHLSENLSAQTCVLLQKIVFACVLYSLTSHLTIMVMSGC